MLGISQLFWFWVALLEGQQGTSASNLAFFATGLALALVVFVALKLADRYGNWSAQ